MQEAAVKKHPPSHTRTKPIFQPLAFSVLADQMYQVVESHGYANATLLATFLNRPLGTIQNTLTSMTHGRRLVPLAVGKKGVVYAVKNPSKRKPNILHELGCVGGDLALAWCEEHGFGTVLPVSDATHEQLMQLPVLKRPDRLFRWKRPGDVEGMEFLREYQRSTLTKPELRIKLWPYYQLPPQGKRLLLETETYQDKEKYLRDLRDILGPPHWLKNVWVGCQQDYIRDFERYVKTMWVDVDGRSHALVKE